MKKPTSPDGAEGLPGYKLLTKQERWRQRNPEKYRAQKIVRQALLRGTLQRKPCADCGSPNAEAHHPDYSKPLKVIWLCRIHHKRRHRRTITKGPGRAKP